MIVNIKNIAHVCSSNILSIFLRRETIVFWKVSLLHWLTKLIHQTFYREKTISKYSENNGAMGTECWRLSEIAFYFILTIGFVRILIRIWFTQTILVLIIIVTVFITIVAVIVFITLLFLLLLSLWLSWCFSRHYYWCWGDCRCYWSHFCNILGIIAL